MDDPIISKDTIRARARTAFEQGRARDEHHMNPGAPALADWLDEYDRCALAWHADMAASSTEEAAS